MTGRLTPERLAEIRAAIEPLGHLPGVPTRVCQTLVARAEAVDELLAALDAERAAHNLTRTALEASTELLLIALGHVDRERGFADLAARIDARIMANQTTLGLAVAEADKPHHGTER